MRTDPTAPPLSPAGSGPLRAREAGLALTRRVNRWMISGAVILTGGVSAVTAHAFHARSPTVASSSAPATTPRPAVARRSHAGARRSASTASSNGSGQRASLQAPSQPPTAAAPAPATAPAPVVSGGS
jgi:hypothetical protein